MSLPDEELRAMREAWRFLLDLGNSHGPYKRVPSEVRREAHRIVHHFPQVKRVHALVCPSIVSLTDEELRAMREAWRFLLDLGNSYGPYKRVPSEVRREAHRIVHHFPLGGDPHALIRSAKMGGSHG